MKTLLKGKVALVTGGAKGMGASHCRLLAERGAAVIIADVDPSGEKLAAELRAEGRHAHFTHLDVTSESSWTQVVDDALAAHGKVDILVNNAGVVVLKPVEDCTPEEFDFVFNVNIKGVFLGCKHIIPKMKDHGGSVINMSSMCGVRAHADLAAYNAAKAAVTHLTKSVALHYARQGYGIRCNSVHPGAVHTPILDKVMAQVEDGQALYNSWVATHPVGRLGKPEEISAIVLYLASDESAFATGAEFRIDGGSSL